MALSGILGDVTQGRVSGVLLERQPRVLDAEPEQLPKFEALVRGAASDVALLTGTDPAAGPIRDLAVEAIALETGSAIEYAAYPEQQAPGDTGRGYYLHQRYLEKLATLRAIIANLGGVPADGGAAALAAGQLLPGSPRPQGSFPPPEPYPDPSLEDYPRTQTWGWWPC